jgi:hypothetical protein
LTLDLECAVVEADWDQGALAPREQSRPALRASLRCLATVDLPAGEAQADRGGPVHKVGSRMVGHVEHMFYTDEYLVKVRIRRCGQSGLR